MVNVLRRTGLAGLALACGIGYGAAANAAGEAPTPPALDWSFSGLFGTFDLASTQRGFQVYKEVCSSCHSMDLVSYRNLAQLGFNEDEVAAIAAEYSITDGPNDDGDMFQRPGIPADRFVAPFESEALARIANNGALPPDLSVMAKARAGGPDYLYAFLTGYEEPPDGEELMAGMFWNEYYPGHQVAMPDMLFDDGIIYTDGTLASVDQQAFDVVNFMMFAAEPHLEERKEMGVKVVLFLIVFTALMYAVKRKLWSDVH